MARSPSSRRKPTGSVISSRRCYSYYVSRPLLFGNAATADVGSVSRASATEIDDQVRKVALEPQLAPNLVKAAVEGGPPRGVGVAQLRELPLEWDRQFETLALGPN
ncbi:MAG TPA: hypothetical protein VHC94_16360 [Nitrobacter sp.]|nr:hypothetical protein [Nitrobacter sp.]